MSVDCRHTMARGREGDKGSWCVECGIKVLDVDDRECQDCAHAKQLHDGWICRAHLMAITPTMNVTFHVTDGSCWTGKDNAEQNNT